MVEISQVCFNVFMFEVTCRFIKSCLCSQRKVSTQIDMFLIFFPVVLSPEECCKYIYRDYHGGKIKPASKTSSGNVLRATEGI